MTREEQLQQDVNLLLDLMECLDHSKQQQWWHETFRRIQWRNPRELEQPVKQPLRAER